MSEENESETPNWSELLALLACSMPDANVNMIEFQGFNSINILNFERKTEPSSGKPQY